MTESFIGNRYGFEGGKADFPVTQGCGLSQRVGVNLPADEVLEALPSVVLNN